MSVAAQIREFFATATKPVLFAGAGLSAKAGLPVWGPYMSEVAQLLRSRDPATANIMLECIHDEDFLQAASYFKLTKKILPTEKHQFLSLPLHSYDVSELEPVSKLPFSAYVTTNFDRTLPDLYARIHKTSAITVGRGDPSIGLIPFQEDFYIARIHGALEDYRSMAISNEDYEELSRDTGYRAVLRHLFLYRQILFIGFSFYDPAIRHVLDSLHDETGVTTGSHHLALLPDDANDDFTNRLDRLNIRRAAYSPLNGHAELWDGIKASSEQQVAVPVRQPSEPEPMVLARRYLASCYARATLGNRILSLRDIVLEGLVSHIVASSSEEGITKAEIKQLLVADIPMPDKDAEKLVEASLKHLQKNSLCRRTKVGSLSRYSWSDNSNGKPLSSALDFLVEGAINRFAVRYQGQPTQDVRDALLKFFEHIVLRRGWDLGAAFAAKRTPDHVDVSRAMWQFGNLISVPVVEKLIMATTDLLHAPTAAEAEILGQLGRSSFALELAIQAPHDVLLHKTILPQRIYLDASVLLPSITEGHSHHAIYSDAILRLVSAAQNAAIPIQIVALSTFLNEVVSHRRIAKETAVQIGKDLPEYVVSTGRAFGTSTGNVYLGAYANVLTNSPAMSFDEFLMKYAPYETENQLATWLSGSGISVMRAGNNLRTNPSYGSINHSIEIAFATDLASGKRQLITLEHDALQLSALDLDMARGIKSIFVTADRTLREHIGTSKHRQLANAMVSDVGLPQFIDLLVGTEGSGQPMQGLGRLLWSAQISSEYEVLRNYLIDVALSKFDEAMAMNMGSVAETVARRGVALAAERNIKLLQPDESQRPQAARLLKEVEDEFYAGMKQVLETRRRQDGK